MEVPNAMHIAFSDYLDDGDTIAYVCDITHSAVKATNFERTCEDGKWNTDLATDKITCDLSM